MHGNDEKSVHEFWLENLKGRNRLGNLGVECRIILKWTLKNAI
jgi:hypothetical protein